MALAGGEIRERHFVSAAHLRVDVMDFACESVRRKPLRHCVRIEERLVDFSGVARSLGEVGPRSLMWVRLLSWSFSLSIARFVRPVGAKLHQPGVSESGFGSSCQIHHSYGGVWG